MKWMSFLKSFTTDFFLSFFASPVQSPMRSTTCFLGLVRPITSYSWSPGTCCVWHCKPAFSRRESITSTHHRFSPSPQTMVPSLRPVSRQLLLLSSSSTTSKWSLPCTHKDPKDINLFGIIPVFSTQICKIYT